MPMYTINLDQLFGGMPVWATPPAQPSGHPRGLGNCLKSLMGQGNPVNFATRYADTQADKVSAWLRQLGVDGAEVRTSPNGQVIWDEMEILMNENGEFIVKKRTEDGLEITKYQPVSIETVPIEEKVPMNDGLNGVVAMASDGGKVESEVAGFIGTMNEIRSNIASLVDAAAGGQKGEMVGKLIYANGIPVTLSSDAQMRAYEKLTQIPRRIEELEKRKNAIKKVPSEAARTLQLDTMMDELNAQKVKIGGLDYPDVRGKQRDWQIKYLNESRIPGIEKWVTQLHGEQDPQKASELFAKAAFFVDQYKEVEKLKEKIGSQKYGQVLDDAEKAAFDKISKKLEVGLQSADIPNRVLDPAEVSALRTFASRGNTPAEEERYRVALANWDALGEDKQIESAFSGNVKFLSPDLIRRGVIDINALQNRGLQKAVADAKSSSLNNLAVRAKEFSEADKRLIYQNGPSFTAWLSKVPSEMIPDSALPDYFMRYIRGDAGVMEDIRKTYGARKEGPGEAKPKVNVQDILLKAKKPSDLTPKEQAFINKYAPVRQEIDRAHQTLSGVSEDERGKLYTSAAEKGKGYKEIWRQANEVNKEIQRIQGAITSREFPGIQALPPRPTAASALGMKGTARGRNKSYEVALAARKEYEKAAAQHSAAVAQAERNYAAILQRKREQFAALEDKLKVIREDVSPQERAVVALRTKIPEAETLISGLQGVGSKEQEQKGRARDEYERNLAERIVEFAEKVKPVVEEAKVAREKKEAGWEEKVKKAQIASIPLVEAQRNLSRDAQLRVAQADAKLGEKLSLAMGVADRLTLISSNGETPSPPAPLETKPATVAGEEEKPVATSGDVSATPQPNREQYKEYLNRRAAEISVMIQRANPANPDDAKPVLDAIETYGSELDMAKQSKAYGDDVLGPLEKARLGLVEQWKTASSANKSGGTVMLSQRVAQALKTELNGIEREASDILSSSGDNQPRRQAALARINQLTGMIGNAIQLLQAGRIVGDEVKTAISSVNDAVVRLKASLSPDRKSATAAVGADVNPPPRA